MTDSKRIAGLLGPTAIAMALSEAINLPLLGNSPIGLIYLNGTLLFIAGLSIVRGHNRWTNGWPVLVTLLGWVAVLGGLFRMFAPGIAHSTSPAAYAVLVILFAIGILLTFNAYAGQPRG